MSLTVECPSCQRKYRVAETNAGKKLRCKACSTAIFVPAASSTDQGAELTSLAASAAPVLPSQNSPQSQAILVASAREQISRRARPSSTAKCPAPLTRSSWCR